MTSQSLEARVAHVEGIIAGIEARLDSIKRRLDRLEARMDAIEARMLSNFQWTVGLIVTTWLTTLLAILLRT